MASIFTYDHEPPRVSSPWPTSLGAVLRDASRYHNIASDAKSISESTDCGITKLEAEPQDGPIEYKLHLLLRPRRRLLGSTTTLRVSGSNQSKLRGMQSSVAARSYPTLVPTLLAPSNQSRQNRLQNLTTQLLWRLQQSSPHHSASRSDLVIPTLPDPDVKSLSPSSSQSKLLPGLEESQGALYEIGVSDDGSFVGLVRDELDESLSTLRTMAYSLGCKVKVLREVVVGRCQWTEEVQSSTGLINIQKDDILWVLEALITPSLESQAQPSTLVASNASKSHGPLLDEPDNSRAANEKRHDQLRVSLTGSTTAGKSSLLGILSTSTLDDGRGKVRKSLHKHLHEITSGVTSSLVTEIFGYRDTANGGHTDVINYATDSVSQWTDIHDSCEKGRLIAVTDSAGHLKYRRTTVRGLLSWAPHWTICCIAADNEPHSQGNCNKRGGGAVYSDEYGRSAPHASKDHLELCLELGLPLVVVITKLDLASNSGLRKIVGEVLTRLKAAGRQVAPMFTKNPPADEHELQMLPTEDLQEVADALSSPSQEDVTGLVPLLLTSAVTGAGICRLHALLRQLPIPSQPRYSEHKEKNYNNITSGGLFHIDEVFATSDARSIALLDGSRVVEGHVVSGHLSHASIKLGDVCLVGPFDAPVSFDTKDVGNKVHHAKSCPALKQTAIEYGTSQNSLRVTSESLSGYSRQVQDLEGHIKTWRKVKVVSLRNLRLPVRQLEPGQIGTVGIIYENQLQVETCHKIHSEQRIRKGMVMIRDQGIPAMEELSAYRGFVAVFPHPEMQSMVPGSLVKAYVASIRASAKVIHVKQLPGTPPQDEVFPIDEVGSSDTTSNVTSIGVNASQPQMEMTFEFQGSQEWLELHSRVLVTHEGGDSGAGGLDGFAGEVTRLLG